MTRSIRDVMASLDATLDDVRQSRSWQAIDRKLDIAPVTTAPASSAVVASPLAAAAAVISAALVGALATWFVLRATPSIDAAARVPMVDVSPEAPGPSSVQERTTVQITVDAPEPPPVAKRRPPPSRVLPVTSAKPTKATADELYRQAEAALGVRDRPSARHALERLLVTFPVSPLVDAARYDLALIAIAERDAAGALRQLDELIASGRDPNIVAAARRLRGNVMRR